MGRLSILAACLITLVIGLRTLVIWLSLFIEFTGARRGFTWAVHAGRVRYEGLFTR
jgi:hypothetical protein